MTPIERFSQYFIPEPNSGCWLWDGAIGQSGYGAFSAFGRRGAGAHRISWVLHNGDIPDGKWVLHKCDVRCCVNPGHLFLGTPKENTADMIAKGRQRPPVVPVHRRARGARHGSVTKPHRIKRGSNHPGALLTEDDVRAIRDSNRPGIDLAEQYNVTPTQITRIRKRKVWRHVV